MAFKRNKFGAVKTTVDGLKFDSKLEARRYQELVLLQRAGKISELSVQVPFTIIHKQPGERAVKYVSDFTYRENGELVVEDVKGGKATATPVYKIKKKLMLLVHGIRIKEVYA
jgi:hypothetical protein